MSIASDKRKRAALRRKRREQGKCTNCGDTPLATNADGTQSVKCEECHAKHVGRKPYRMKGGGDAPSQIVDVDPTPLSATPKYLEYEPRVAEIILHTQCGITASEINRVLQPPHPDYTALALERLFESIEGRQVGAFWKYFPRELRRTPNLAETNHHAGIFGKYANDRTQPLPESMGAKL